MIAAVAVLGLPAAASAATPDVSFFVLTPTGATTAEVDGTVNPGGEATTYAVEYDLASSTWCGSGGTSGSPANTITGTDSIPTDNADHDVTLGVTGLTAGTDYCAELVATNGSGSGEIGPLQWTQGEASALTYDTYSWDPTDATMDGVVDAGGQSGGTYQVQYDAATSPWCTSNGTSGAPANTTSPLSFAFSDGTYHEVSVDFGGLVLGTTYCAQLWATNSYGGSGGGLVEWTQGTPSVDTNAATATGATAATVTGDVNPIGQQTTYKVEYDLASSAWCASGGASGSAAHTTPPTSLGATDDNFHNVSVDLGGLTSSTEYCGAVVATNQYGSGVSYQVSWTQPAPPPKETLTVSVSGTGSGMVTSNPAGIDCGSSGSACSMTVDHGTVVTLTATADSGSVFNILSWIPGCSTGNPPEINRCIYTVNSDVTIPVIFSAGGSSPPPSHAPYVVHVKLGGDGSGTVTSDPAGIDCGYACSFDFSPGGSVLLTAKPARGSRFVDWSVSGASGPCTWPNYSGLSCPISPPPYSTTTVTATFERVKPPKCSLQTASKVALHGRDAGKLTLGLDCTQTATYSINGEITTVHGRKKSTVSVVKAHGHIAGHTWRNVTVKLSKAALAGLRMRVPESATFVLAAKNVGGSTTTTHRVKRLK